MELRPIGELPDSLLWAMALIELEVRAEARKIGLKRTGVSLPFLQYGETDAESYAGLRGTCLGRMPITSRSSAIRRC